MIELRTGLPYAYDLAAPGVPPEAIGRKAAGLQAMLADGLPVPAASAVTTAAYAAMLASPGVAPNVAAALAAPGDDAALAAVAGALLHAPLPAGLVEALAAAYGVAGGEAVAVRSSGAAEDLAGASFAGMYESVLAVTGLPAVEAALRRCWASAWSPRVAAYAAAKGVERADLAMGVVIQRMVPADVAGVMFTIDPMTGIEGHMRIEAVAGLGEALVAGEATPDRYLVGKADGAIAAQILVGEQPLLSRADAASLAALGRKLQARFRRPQDVEWAIAGGTIWLVQSRPVTAVSYAGLDGEWTTADFKDGGVSASVCSPYMWSLYDFIWQRAMPDYLRKIRLLTHDEPVVWGKVFYGRPYWNVGEVKRCLHRVPGWNERSFDRDLGIEGAYEGDGTVIPTNAQTVLNALPVLFALKADYKARIAENEAFVRAFPAMVARYDQDPATLAPEALVARYERLLATDYDRTETAYFMTIYNTSNAKTDFTAALAKTTAEPPLSSLALLSGLADLKHLEPLKALAALAERVRADAGLAALVLGTPAEDLQEAILGGDHAPFWAEVTAYLHRFRHHAVAELDITQPRWDEDPTFVLRTLKAYVQAPPPARPADVYGPERARAEAHFKAQGLKGLLAGKAFFAELDQMRRYAWWREEMRDCSSRVYALIRRETIALARALAREGKLARWDDVWHLKWQEALALAKDELSGEAARALVEARREELDGWRDWTNPNELGRRFKAGGAAPAEAPPGGLAGIPCSPGRVTATVRVVPTIHDGGELLPGEILVTRFTDPGWTPLFSHLAGVVTETGGILSHAAVIAREYGIPAILAVPGATAALRTGQVVTIDGATGVIMPE